MANNLSLVTLVAATRPEDDRPVVPELEFVECEVCRGETGSPTLCPSCQHNRAVISYLLATPRQRVTEWRHAPRNERKP